jgi:hypothetical protein
MARKKGKNKKIREKSRQRSVITHDVARGELTAMSNTSAIGVFVINTYLLSTDLLPRWTALAAIYQRWRIKWMKFTYVSQLATTINGRVGMFINEDADGSVPTTFVGAAGNRVFKEVTAYRTSTMYYRPNHEDWLWTKDLALNEDRLEYPGYFGICSGSFTTAGVPGYVTVSYHVEFSSPCNSESTLARMKKITANESKEGKEEEDLKENPEDAELIEKFKEFLSRRSDK